MTNKFQHKYRLRLLIFVVLFLVLINISLPFVEQYNSDVSKKQHKLAAEAGVKSKEVSFTLYSSNNIEQDLYSTLTLTLTLLLLSLISTKRMILSLLFAFIFLVLTVAAIILLPRNGFWFVESIYFVVSIIAGILSLSFWLAFTICRFCNRRFEIKHFLK